MSLLKRAIPSCKLENVDLKILLEDVKAGDKKAFDSMILGHTRLAVSIVNNYIRKHRVIFLVDELDGAAFEGIVVAVDRIKNGHLSHDNFTGYIICYIHEYVGKLLDKYFRIRCQQEEEPIWYERVSENFEKLIDLQDQITRITKTNFEKQVIELRSQKYTDKEVAKKLNVTITTVARTRHKLKKRLTNERMARRV